MRKIRTFLPFFFCENEKTFAIGKQLASIYITNAKKIEMKKTQTYQNFDTNDP